VRRLPILVLLIVLAAAGAAESVNRAFTTAVVGAGESRGVVTLGDLAVIGSGPAVIVFDLTDPADPVQLGSSRFGDLAVPVGTIDGLALVFVSDHGVDRLEVIEPNPEHTPQSVGALALPVRSRPDDLVVVDDTAWVVTASRENGLLGIDLSHPAQPRLATTTELPAAASRLTAVDNILSLATSAGLLVVDVSNAAEPSIIASVDIGLCRSIASDGVHTYVATDDSLSTFDASVPASPSLVSTTALERTAAPMSMRIIGESLHVGLVDHHRQIAEPDGGMRTFDLSEPGQPVAIADSRFSSGAWALDSLEGAIVIADIERGLRVFDAALDNGHHELARRNTTMDDALSVAVHQDIAYLGDQGVRIFDIADHHAPELLASVELDGEIIDVVVTETGDRIAALAQGATLHVFDASDPVNPVLAWSAPSNGWRLAVSDTVLAVAAGNLGVSLFDISDPGDTHWLTHIPTN
jgi:hypothetical protein